MKCQLTYIPFGKNDIAEQVDEVIDIIESYDVESKVGDLSTLVEGNREEVLNLISGIYSIQDDNNKQFRLHVELLSSNNYS